MPKRNTNLVAVYLLVMRGSEVLLQRRFNTGHQDGNYGLPSGHLDKGETFTTALVREVEEEIGIRLKKDDLEFAHMMHARCGPNEPEYSCAYFIARKFAGEIENLEPDKCDDLSWFPLSALPENTIPYVRQACEHIEKDSFYSEYWI